MFQLKQYVSTDAALWNDHVAKSKNGTFLADRRYVEYHGDRFDDCSLMCFLDDKLYATLPANREGDTLVSHAGLTYGGLIMGSDANAATTLQLFKEINAWLLDRGIRRVIYKPSPWVYHTMPAEEDLYAIVEACQARLTGRKIASVIKTDNPAKWRRDRRYAANKAEHNGLTTEWSDDWSSFWHILTTHLAEKYDARPVHSLQEIQLLATRFPDNIRLYVARAAGELVGGTVIYTSRNVAHTQYIASTNQGRSMHAIDLIFRRLLTEELSQADFFDFGTSMAPDGHSLCESLIYQKEGFGGRAICYDTYEWEL